MGVHPGSTLPVARAMRCELIGVSIAVQRSKTAA